tara:strand:+ start:44 stop:1438 length:1395 start_codon:yes stop_codon:yes gene_type:complete
MKTKINPKDTYMKDDNLPLGSITNVKLSNLVYKTETQLINGHTMAYIPLIEPGANSVEFSYALYITLDAGKNEYLSMQELRVYNQLFWHPTKEMYLEAHGLIPEREFRRREPRAEKIVKRATTMYRDTLIPKHVHEDLASGKCKKVILDYSLEGFSDIDWDYVSTIFGVEQSKLVWLTGICRPNHLNCQSDVTVQFNNRWESFVWAQQHYDRQGIHEGYEQQIQDIKDLKIRKYHALSYNRRPHMHRAYLLTRLDYENLLDRTLYSWGGSERELSNEELTMMYQYAKHWKYLRDEHFDSFAKMYSPNPVTFPNEDLETNKAHSIEFDHVKDAYFQIISETFVTNTLDSSDPFLSEKSYKPFISGMPFVTWGQQNTIAALKDQGYNTFDDWIHHSYDGFKDVNQRFDLLMEEIKRLYAIPPEEWSVMLKEMLPAIEHNKKRLLETVERYYPPGVPSIKLEELGLY